MSYGSRSRAEGRRLQRSLDRAKATTAAQAARQRVRGRGGRYADMPRCDGGCDRPVNVQGTYLSHPLTDCVDAEGRNFGGDALVLCLVCGRAASRPELQTVRAWQAFVARTRYFRGNVGARFRVVVTWPAGTPGAGAHTYQKGGDLTPAQAEKLAARYVAEGATVNLEAIV